MFTAETSTTLQRNYTPIKINKYFKKETTTKGHSHPSRRSQGEGQFHGRRKAESH